MLTLKKNPTNSNGKVAILSYDEVGIFRWIFMKLAQLLCLISSWNPIDFEQKFDGQYGKSSNSKLKIFISCS